MKIVPVDSEHNLFLIQDFYSKELVSSVESYDHDSYLYENVLVEGSYTRRNIVQGQAHTLKLYAQSLQNIKDIGIFLKKDLKLHSYNLWYDLPGYYMNKHLDAINHVHIGMQVYLTNSDQSLGTYFYNEQGVRHFFPYIANTGYLMINSKVQWHAAPNIVPNGHSRLSMYHRISIR